jgi:toxin ParE1/3/4
MAVFVLAKRARADLLSIARYTEAQWGQRQAKKYLGELAASFELIATTPKIGRPFGPEMPNVFRKEQGSHVVFYRRNSSVIFVLRILHKNMLPKGRLT